jgi:hypothetical protein
MWERGMSADHTTISRRVQRYAPELEKRCQPLLKATADSLRVDEASVKGIPICGICLPFGNKAAMRNACTKK